MNTNITPGKRILSVLLTVIMVFSMVPLSVFAANGGEAEVITANGSTTNFNSFAGAVEYASKNGGTLRLLSNVEVPVSENPDDIPFITGEFTLDLNGKNINEVGVGSVTLDEEQEVIKGEAGTLTVIDSVGNGNIECLSVNTGALTVAGGAIAELEAKSYAATVNITGGEVETFSLNENRVEEISATVSGGSVQWIRMNGSALTVTGGEYPEKINMDIGGGTAQFTGGTFADLGLSISQGEICLTGGTFAKISTKFEGGSSEYKEPTLASLLGDSCAFYGTDNGSIVNADVLTLENVKILANHEHSYGSGGKCTGCGAPCPHGNVVNATGICEDCKTQLEAKVTYTGKAPVYYTSFRDAIDSISHNQSEQVTVTLLNSKFDLGTENLYLNANNNIRLDLNGYIMSGSKSIVVNAGHSSALTVANGKLDSKLTIEAAGGDVTVADDCEGVGTIKVTDAKSTLTVLGGNIDSLRLPYTNTESLKNIKLSGGYFNSVSFPNASNSDTVAITDMLEVGYAFKDNKGILKTTPGGLVPYGLTVSAKTYFATLEVVKCEHGAVNEVKGYCNYCGKLYAAKITDKGGNVSYVEVIDDRTFILAENGTIKLLQDADRCNVTRNLTFDLNGRHVNTLDLKSDGTVTVKGSGSINNLILGNSSNDTTLIIEKPMIGTVDVGLLAVGNSTKTKLDGWSFGQIKRYDNLTLSDLLADGYAFFDKTSGKPVYFSGNNTDVSANYYIDKHDHTFTANADGKDECECGLICNHANINENGKCESCKTQIYVAALTKADNTKQNYRFFADAWTAAIANKNSTLKLLCNLDLGSGDGSSVLKVFGGKFTLDLGDYTLEGTAQNTVIQVSGTADIKIINGKINNNFDGSGSSLSPTDAGAVRVENGGAELTLNGVKFTAGSNENTIGAAVYVIDGKLTVANSQFGGLVMLLKRTSDVSVNLASSNFLYGIAYGYTGTEMEYETVGSFFANGNMFFDGNGKYIDITNDSLWEADDLGSYKAVTFSFNGSCSVKPHTHDSYVDGKCAECDYACPHNSGKNNREASYFQKAICSVCHAEYGNYVKDTVKPTGKIEIVERNWWESFIHTITFCLFYKEKVTVEITAADDSYTQAGYDDTKHAVKIEYFISNTALSEDTVKGSAFAEYIGAIDISNDENYVVYAKLTDYAGNETYISTDGFVIDTTPPVIEGCANGQTKKYQNGERVEVCTGTEIRFIDATLKEVYIIKNGYRDLVWGDTYMLDGFYTEQWIAFEAQDEVGNVTTVEFYVHKEHSFNEETGVCTTCKYQATVLIKYINMQHEEKIAFGNSFDNAFGNVQNPLVTEQGKIKLYGNAEKSKFWSTYCTGKWVIDLNGYAINNPPGVDLDSAFFQISQYGDVTIVGNGALNVSVLLRDRAALTIDGNCSVYKIEQSNSSLTVNSGSIGTLVVTESDSAATGVRKTALCGGHYNNLKVKIEGLTCADLLGRGCCFEGLTFEQAKVTELSNVTATLCYHENRDKNNFCPDCGMQFVIAVRTGNVETLFDTFEDAIHYAEQHDGCTVKLLQDLTLNEATVGSLLVDGYKVELRTGSYTIDLNGKALNLNGNYFIVSGNGNLTIDDRAGGGKVMSSGSDLFGSVYAGSSGGNEAKLTVTGGEFTVDLTSYDRNALVLKGGSFASVTSNRWSYCSLFTYLADGYTFAFSNPSGGNNYANEGNVKVDAGGNENLENVTVVLAPVYIPDSTQPQNKTFYLTSPNEKKLMSVWLSCRDLNADKKITLTLEKTNGTAITSKERSTSKILSEAFDLKALTEGSEQYRVKIEFDGYVLYSNTFTITMAVCEHPGYDETTHKCTQCECNLVAAIVKDGQTAGYVTFAEALAAAQTNANKGGTLKLFADMNEEITVENGAFTLDAEGNSVNGSITVQGNSMLTLKNGFFNGSITAESGELRVDGGSYKNNLTVKSGGKLFIYSGGCLGTVTVESGGNLTVKNGGVNSIIAKSGSTLTVSNGSHTTVTIEENVNAVLSGGSFGKISVAGKKLINCLDEGFAFANSTNKKIIDGRCNEVTGVSILAHTHTFAWNTATHEKLCGCGFVEAVDTEAPVISTIKDGGVYYNLVYFTVTDANDFTVTVDGAPAQYPYRLLGDNPAHTITATDVAGNTVTITVTVYKLYFVTLPRDTVGYTVQGVSAISHGMDYEFTVKIADGYSKAENYRVLVNGKEPDSALGDEREDKFLVANVSENLVITVEGVVDQTPPEVEVNIRGNSFKEFLNKITFGLFFKGTQTVTVTAGDTGSGVAKVGYLLSETAFTAPIAITGDWTELALENGAASFSIEPNKKAYIYIRVTDVSGNAAVVNSEGVVLYTDAEAITGAMTIKRLDGADASFAVKLNGNTVNTVCNGDTMLVYDRDYTVSANGIITLKAGYLSTLAAGEYTIRVAYNPLGESFGNGSGDEPAITTVKLTVEKKMPEIVLAHKTLKTYDGEPIDPFKIDRTMETDGALTWEYKPVGADDSEYTTTAPKNAGEYTVRLTTAETKNYQAGETTVLFIIVPKEITVLGTAVESSKVYDGTTYARITSAGTVYGIVNKDKVAVNIGDAAYVDGNVGTGKEVVFSNFALLGDDAANYVLSAQPASTTASITPKELTIANLKVQNKQYDGKNTAEIDGTPTLVGLVDGDMLELINGVPTFNSVAAAKNIPVSFTAFTLSGNRVTVGNYKLVQPTGITANIVEYAANGSEYGVNSNNWINTDFVITAKQGYKLSQTNTANGEWVESLTASDENSSGKLQFYVKNTATGAISSAITENYKIDKTKPTGTVTLNERTAFQDFIHEITFGLFFGKDVQVKLTANDEASGVKSVQYFKSERIFSDNEVRAITDWTDNSDFNIKAKDAEKFIIYVRIEDNAGNVAFISSNGATFDTTAPGIVGVENKKTYYVTKKVTINDENLKLVTLNEKPVKEVFTLAGDKGAVYDICAEDEAGNVTKYTVNMQPISAITSAIAELTNENVKSSNANAISSVERQILGIAEAFDSGESTDAEWNKLTEAAAKCKALNQRIAEVANESARLTNAVNAYDIDKVTSGDKAELEKLIANIDALLNGDNLTQAERTVLEALKGTAQALLDRIAAAKDAADDDKITAVKDITKDNVKLENKESLEKAEKALEGALCDFNGNYTENEQKELETKLETVKAALAAIGNAEKAAEEIGKLPLAEDAKLSDKSALDQVQKLLEGLTENEKAMLGKETLGKVEALNGKIKLLAEEKASPKTGDTGNLALWIALLFIGGGAVSGTAIVSKKKKSSAK